MDKSNKKSQKLGKNGNLNYFPTASPKSYWELGSQVPIQFPRLEHEELQDAEMRMISNQEEGWIDLSKRRVTDIKGNSSVRFPSRTGNFEMEARLEVLRVEAMEVYRRYAKEIPYLFCR